MKRRDSAFVAAAVPRMSLRWIWGVLGAFFRRNTVQTVRREAVRPVPPIYHGVPDHLWSFRKRAADARMLLRLVVDGKPATRRAWLALGRSDRRWRLARAVLIRAKVIDRDGRMRYSGRDAINRLDVYLDAIEQKCRTSGRYVAP